MVWCRTWGGREIRRSGWAGKLLAALFVVLVAAPVLLLLIFRFVPLPGTPQMLWSMANGKGAQYRWSDHIPAFLGRAVIGSEDQNFCSHNGFDWKSIDQAMAAHDRHPAKRLRGASTISQQTARTLFLIPVRSWVRKGAEAYLTILVEALWPKKRILQAYLNLVDWGHGNFGAEAAARAYFGIDAGAAEPEPGGPPRRGPAGPGQMERRPAGSLCGLPVADPDRPGRGCDPGQSGFLR